MIPIDVARDSNKPQIIEFPIFLMFFIGRLMHKSAIQRFSRLGLTEQSSGLQYMRIARLGQDRELSAQAPSSAAKPMARSLSPEPEYLLSCPCCQRAQWRPTADMTAINGSGANVSDAV
jgi:hypothetical protein